MPHNKKFLVLCIVIAMCAAMFVLPTAATATTGQDWVQATADAGFNGRWQSGAVSFDNKLWFIGGYDGDFARNDVWSSTDGQDWDLVTGDAAFPARAGFAITVFDGKMWIFGGYGIDDNYRNDVWSSSDGETWTEATSGAQWGTRDGVTAWTYDDKMWITGGNGDTDDYNDVWYSTDGATWTQATAHAAFSQRWAPSSLVFGGKMWVFGGYSESDGLSDVWSSTDGATWTQVTADAGWPNRWGAGAGVLDGKMWIFGGGDDKLNDVWSSADGATWTESEVNDGFSGRMAFSSAVFDDKLWVLSGYDGDNYTNDVFFSAGDGIPDGQVTEEADASNDSNGDGIIDSEQDNVSGFVNGLTGKQQSIEVNPDCILGNVSIKQESALPSADSNFNYPFHLVNFSAECGTPGYSTTVTLYFYDADAANFVLRKYLPASNSYVTVGDATIADRTIYGRSAVVATFTVADGGVYDTDGARDGTITDPAGLGVSTSTLPATGSTHTQEIVTALMLLMVGCVLARTAKRRSSLSVS